MRHFLLLCFGLFFLLNGLSASQVKSLSNAVEVPGLDYYLPTKSADYDPQAPRPDDVLGWPFGAWHLQHHELVQYLGALSAWSDRIALLEYGRSHGRRPLVALIITSPENHERLEAIRTAHLDSLQEAYEQGQRAGGASGAVGKGEKSTQNTPVISYFTYGIHGDEHSGISAAPLLAYHLAASRSSEVTEFLKDNIIIIDPCLNPDGTDVFASWVNRHRGQKPSAHRADREHRLWPEGRLNYYWADLNRDWLPVVQPESRARMEFFGQWMPHLLSDFHDMRNINRTYFFQPGIPHMVNPLHPEGNQALTARVAAHYGKGLDALGSLYYTKESFDDYYIGKGSTYPDLLGSIGILLEQASSRGFHQDTEHGRLTFPFTIRNQLTTSLSALQAVAALGEELQAYQLDFYRQTPSRARAQPVRAHLVSAPGDPHRLQAFRDLLDLHQIRYGKLQFPLEVDGKLFAVEQTLVIPTEQPRYLLLTGMLEQRTQFPSDASFNDVSAWHYPSAYGMHHAQWTQSLPPLTDWEVAAPKPAEALLSGAEHPVAYLFSWTNSHAPAALSQLLEQGIRCWAAGKPFTTSSRDGSEDWGRGTIVVPVAFQDDRDSAALRELLADVAATHQIRIHGVASGLSAKGIDLGSPSMIPLREPRVLLVVGTGASATSTGEVWHQFDQVWQTPLTMVEGAQVSDQLLRDFHTVILTDTPLERLPAAAGQAIESWVRGGGCLIAIGSSADSLVSAPWVNAEKLSAEAAEGAAAATSTAAAGNATTATGSTATAATSTAATSTSTTTAVTAKNVTQPANRAAFKSGVDPLANSAAPKDTSTPQNSEISKHGSASKNTAFSGAIHPAAEPYEGSRERLAQQRVTGIVVRAWFDPSHPLAWGYDDSHDYIALLKANSLFLKPTFDSVTDPLRYSAQPLLSGYIAGDKLELLKGAAAVKIVACGQGRVILFADNPLFRGHWHGSSRLLANAVFFGYYTDLH